MRSRNALVALWFLSERGACSQGSLRAAHPSGGVGTTEVVALICAAALIAAGIVWFGLHKWGSPPRPKWAVREHRLRETAGKVARPRNPTRAPPRAASASLQVQGTGMPRVAVTAAAALAQQV